jgi:hypothetical protein
MIQPPLATMTGAFGLSFLNAVALPLLDEAALHLSNHAEHS